MQMYLFQATRWFRVGGRNGAALWFTMAVFGIAWSAALIQTDGGVGGQILVGSGVGVIGVIFTTFFWLSQKDRVRSTKVRCLGPYGFELGLLGMLGIFALNLLIFVVFDKAWVSWEVGHVLVGASTLATVCIAFATPLKAAQPPRPVQPPPPTAPSPI